LWLQKFYEFALLLQPSSFIAAFIAGNLIWNSLTSLLLTIIMALAGTLQFFLGGLLIGFIVYKIKNRN